MTSNTIHQSLEVEINFIAREQKSKAKIGLVRVHINHGLVTKLAKLTSS